MKKLLLLALVGGFALSASAQWQDRGYDRDRYEHRAPDFYRGRHDRLAEINARYDNRIEAVRRDPYLTNRQKRREIRSLERERRMVLNDRRNRTLPYGREMAGDYPDRY